MNVIEELARILAAEIYDAEGFYNDHGEHRIQLEGCTVDTFQIAKRLIMMGLIRVELKEKK